MHITRARIQNFRGLEDIEFFPSLGVNVIVGPNAVGKTSVLEAIRLTKSFLAPRYRDEVSQVLVSLGAATQHMLFGEAQLDFAALAGESSKLLEVMLDIDLSEKELSTLTLSQLGLAQALVRSRIGQERASNQLDLIQFMSSSEGQTQLENAKQDIHSYLEGVQASKKVSLTLSMELIGQNLQVESRDTTAQLVIQALEAACSPSTALVSYFPADRALPSGEVNIQIGSADMQQQVFSHLAQPATKYTRLKQIIVNSYVLGSESQENLANSFNVIFEQLLPGKQLQAIQQKPSGNLSVLIRDVKSGRVFDIDNMSSGEKGLILTFLLLRSGAAPGGIVLLDEPELHLNPAVCSRLVSFLQSQIIIPLDLQVFICTHSAEILSSALHQNNCSVFHLRTSRDITPVDRKDKAELFDILRRLGLSSMDVLSWQGTIFVEGEDDIELLPLGLPELLSSFQIKELGGRAEIEKDVRRLQEAEKRGEIQRLNVFVFDHDKKPTNLVSTPLVRILQWDRYSIESYLLDENILHPLLKQYANIAVESQGSLRNLLKELAMEQLSDEVVSKVYEKLEPENCGPRRKEVIGKSYVECSSLLVERIIRVKESVQSIESISWTQDFITKCKNLEQELRHEWDMNWRTLCNSKRLFTDLQARQKIKVSVSFLKCEIMKDMRREKTTDWSHMENLLIQSIKQIHETN
jgi:predicted ATP-dependent endonuclease of OLD family